MLTQDASAVLPHEKGMLAGWQPIKSASKDGEPILVCDARVSGGFHQVVSWDDAVSDPAFRWATSDGPNFHRDAFTHWMPLPEPPEA